MIIESKIKNQACLKQCPHADFVLRVGSIVCSGCKYNKLTRYDFDSCYVDCICPDDKILKNFEDLQNKDA
jgi:hypothetical protein